MPEYFIKGETREKKLSQVIKAKNAVEAYNEFFRQHLRKNNNVNYAIVTDINLIN
jgi:hypothetical protein